MLADDPRALKIYIDGSARENPGGPSGCAGILRYPDDWNRPDEVIFEVGFDGSTNQRMELRACVEALRYIRDNGHLLSVQRILIATDSKYLHEGQYRVNEWKRQGWKNRHGRPIENPDLWKEFGSVRGKTRVRTDIVWKKGKRLPILKAVDKAAKDAAASPTQVDRGFLSGKVGRSKLGGRVASQLFPAKGSEAVIRVYRKAFIGGVDKIYFETFCDQTGLYSGKFHAYAGAEVEAQLHRGHAYRVLLNSSPGYPQIEKVLAEVLFAEAHT